ncbi:LAME_0E13586g1_1 [Lachancea meyersii CBS 8951]|uniref:alpha-1,2-Mannosidase n=1 Tax=Lachancea meyersii CBS 8951 TaxID=1266667 RepID=A0A1G4JM72_9SACH|nr:LAME_0E13586g1_1 [Lachancea meyersii CBS 8951]
MLLPRLCVLSLCLCVATSFHKFAFTKPELALYRQETRELFYHAFDNYMALAYPHDELDPIRCQPRTRNFKDDSDLDRNDVMGNFSATLVDSLTTLAIMGDKDQFQLAVELVRADLDPHFDINVTVQVFETTIRILGGLLSAHLYASDSTKKVYLGVDYDGFLLQRANSLADRLLPAYLTETGMPLPRINLAHKYRNISPDILQENNAAAIASPILEFTLLSYLTHDDKYKQVSEYAFHKVWSLRSKLDLLPMSFSPHTQRNFNHYTGTGASIDSFYEYALKGAVLFDDDRLWRVWEDTYYALRKHCKGDWFFANVDIYRGEVVLPWIDSLSAFFPGLQVLAGDVTDAQTKHLLFLKLWNHYGGIPERWNFLAQTDQSSPEQSSVSLPWYPLRPEFVESTYYIYRATKDPLYLKIAWSILQDLKNLYKTSCGLAGSQDVFTGKLQDRMETFVLSETLKYLFLIFDEENELHTDLSNVVFSTEAHPFWLHPSSSTSYHSLRYFNDRFYSDHLDGFCERDTIAKNSVFSQAIKGISRYVSHVYEHNANDDQMPENSSTSTATIEPGMCPALKNQNDNTARFLNSPMLSDYERLFEVDYRYATTLLKPSWLSNRTSLELHSDFYDIWCWKSKGIPTCRAAPTTEIFDVSFAPGYCRVGERVSKIYGTPLSNVTIGSLAGIRMQLEALHVGALDAYGNMIDAGQIDLISRQDDNVYSTCPAVYVSGDSKQVVKRKRGEQLLTVYRATAIDGAPLTHDAVVHVNLSSAESRLGSGPLRINDQNMLMINGVPVINVISVVN